MKVQHRKGILVSVMWSVNAQVGPAPGKVQVVLGRLRTNVPVPLAAEVTERSLRTASLLMHLSCIFTGCITRETQKIPARIKGPRTIRTTYLLITIKLCALKPHSRCSGRDSTRTQVHAIAMQNGVELFRLHKGSMLLLLLLLCPTCLPETVSTPLIPEYRRHNL
jgi:hypothetical protein